MTDSIPFTLASINDPVGKTHDANGYVVLSHSRWGENQGRREHRVVMEIVEGRKLGTSDVVHHVNGVRSDNHPENLTLETRASHNRKHGTGVLMACDSCGKERWYQPALARRLASPYKCRSCRFGRNWNNAGRRGAK